jgi:hypothetical protein
MQKASTGENGGGSREVENIHTGTTDGRAVLMQDDKAKNRFENAAPDDGVTDILLQMLSAA